MPVPTFDLDTSETIIVYMCGITTSRVHVQNTIVFQLLFFNIRQNIEVSDTVLHSKRSRAKIGDIWALGPAKEYALSKCVCTSEVADAPQGANNL